MMANNNDETTKIQNKIDKDKNAIKSFESQIEEIQLKAKNDIAELNKKIKQKQANIEKYEEMLSLAVVKFATKTLKKDDLNVADILKALLEGKEVSLSNLVKEKKEEKEIQEMIELEEKENTEDNSSNIKNTEKTTNDTNELASGQ